MIRRERLSHCFAAEQRAAKGLRADLGAHDSSRAVREVGMLRPHLSFVPSGLLTLAVGGAMVLLAALHPGYAGAQEVRYVYDAKGQLVAAVDVDGSAAVYSWDPNGKGMW